MSGDRETTASAGWLFMATTVCRTKRFTRWSFAIAWDARWSHTIFLTGFRISSTIRRSQLYCGFIDKCRPFIYGTKTHKTHGYFRNFFIILADDLQNRPEHNQNLQHATNNHHSLWTDQPLFCFYSCINNMGLLQNLYHFLSVI